MTIASYMATGHKTMGYLPSFTRVSNHSPPTYVFHVLHKKKPAATIKYLTALPLSKYTSVACCNLLVGKHGVLASCGCPAREGQAGLCTWLATRDAPHSLYLRHSRLLSHTDGNPQGLRVVPMVHWAD